MIENALTKRNFSLKLKITIKSLISVAVIALAVILPQTVHLAAGQSGGVQWLPMYLPVLLGGCLLGAWWGLGVGILSPLVSFAITSAWGNPMPALARLPFMMADLGVYGVVSGLFSGKIAQNGWMAFPAVLLASVCGRTSFMLLVLIFQSLVPFTPTAIWAQIQTGLLAVLLQAVIAPLLVMGLKRLLKEKHD